MPKPSTPRWRKAALVQCRQCGQWIVQGFDSDMAALMVNIDPTPISLATEKALQAYGVPTYTLHMGSIHWRWVAKSVTDARKEPWGSLHAAHAC